MNKKIPWINEWRAIGIIAVVIGHIYYGDLNKVIFMFHMPLFFFMSGYLYKPRPKLGSYLIKKSVSLILPYLCFLLTLSIVLGSLNGFELGNLGSALSNTLLGGRALQGAYGVFWFVTCLFATQQIVNLLFNKFSITTIAIIMTMMLLLGYVNDSIFPEFWLPLNINVVLAAAPIFYLGHLYKKGLLRLSSHWELLLGGIAVILAILLPGNTFDMKYANYGIPILTFASGIIMTMNTITFSKKIATYKFLGNVFSKIGKSSMVIMYLHLPFILLINNLITTNRLAQLFGSMILSFISYSLLKKFTLTKALFLGQPKAFGRIFHISYFSNITEEQLKSIVIVDAIELSTTSFKRNTKVTK